MKLKLYIELALLRFIYPVMNLFFKIIFKKELSNMLFKQFIKHYIVGGISAGSSYLIFNTLKMISFSTVAASATNYIVVSVTAFFLQKHFTYKVRHHSIWQPILFVVNILLNFILETTILFVLIDKLKISPFISKLISTITIAPISFIFQKFMVFTNRR